MRTSLSHSTLAVLFLAALFMADSVSPQPAVLSADDMNRFQEMFAHEDALARQIAIQEFEKAVAESDRVDALVEIWDGVLDRPDRERVHAGILAYLVQGDYPKRYDRPALNQRIHRARESDDPAMRRTLLNIYRLRDDADSRQRVQEFLDDDDLGVRKLALTSVVRHENGRELLEKYVETYRDLESHAESIERAELYLRRLSTEP